MKSFLSALEKPIDTCASAYSSKSSFSFGLNVSETPFCQSWILVSRATDHMTHSSKHFSTYSPCPIHKKIETADKSLASVAGIGDVTINPSITLKIVIHDPKLPINLVSVQDSHKTYFVM